MLRLEFFTNLSKFKNRILKTVILPLLFSSFIFQSSQIQGQQISTDGIRVLTFNIYHGETMKGDFDLNLIANVIKSTNPDLVAVQEVDVNTNRAGKMNILSELGIRTGLIPLFGQAMPFNDGFYGVGILSRLPAWKTQNHQLPASIGREPRTALEALFVLPSGDTIRFVSTHLDNVDENTDRMDQGRALNQLFAIDEIPTILAGDLNAKPNSETMKILLKEWGKSFSKDIPTAPSKNPKSKIDYILFRKEKKWEVVDTKVLEEEIASDHRPVLRILKLLN